MSSGPSASGASAIKAVRTDRRKASPSKSTSRLSGKVSKKGPLRHTCAQDNLGALDGVLTDEQRGRRDAASAPDPTFPGVFMARQMVQQLIFGGAVVKHRNPVHGTGG